MDKTGVWYDDGDAIVGSNSSTRMSGHPRVANTFVSSRFSVKAPPPVVYHWSDKGYPFPDRDAVAATRHW